MPKDEHIKTLNDIQTMGEFEKMFKDGIVLAKLINCLYPGKSRRSTKSITQTVHLRRPRNKKTFRISLILL